MKRTLLLASAVVAVAITAAFLPANRLEVHPDGIQEFVPYGFFAKMDYSEGDKFYHSGVVNCPSGCDHDAPHVFCFRDRNNAVKWLDMLKKAAEKKEMYLFDAKDPRICK